MFLYFMDKELGTERIIPTVQEDNRSQLRNSWHHLEVLRSSCEFRAMTEQCILRGSDRMKQQLSFTFSRLFLDACKVMYVTAAAGPGSGPSCVQHSSSAYENISVTWKPTSQPMEETGGARWGLYYHCWNQTMAHTEPTSQHRAGRTAAEPRS